MVNFILYFASMPVPKGSELHSLGRKKTSEPSCLRELSGEMGNVCTSEEPVAGRVGEYLMAWFYVKERDTSKAQYIKDNRTF